MGKPHVFRIGDDVCLWVEQDSSVMIKAVSGSDPVELEAREARQLAKVLEECASQIERDDQTGWPPSHAR